MANMINTIQVFVCPAQWKMLHFTIIFVTATFTIPETTVTFSS